MHLASPSIALAEPGLEAATRIAAAGFDQPVSDALAADVRGHLAGSDLTYTLTDAAGTFGFALFNVWLWPTVLQSSSVLYLSGIILDPAHQHHGIAGQVITKARTDACVWQTVMPDYLALRTASPRMWRTGRRLCSEWLPNAYSIAKPELTRVGEHAAARLGASQFPVHTGCYNGPLYGTQPRHDDPALQSWWDGLCDFDRGDAVICVGRFHPLG